MPLHCYGPLSVLCLAWIVASATAVPTPRDLSGPPRGWSSQGVFDCWMDCSLGMDTCLSDVLMRKMIDILAQPEYVAAGYDWVLLGKCWSASVRDARDELMVNDTRFPLGIKAVADYAHDHGIRLALYVSIASYFMPGLHGHIIDDVATITSWGVDMIYVDTQQAAYPSVNSDFKELGEAIRRSGSNLKVTCSWPDAVIEHGMKPNYDDVKRTCDVYRSTRILTSGSSWNDVMTVMDYYNNNENHVKEAAGSQNKWADMGMLLLGQGNLNSAQWQAQIAVWTMYSSAMFVSFDLSTLAPEVKSIMLKREVLNTDDDTLDQRPTHYTESDQPLHVWHRHASYGNSIVLMVNPGPNPNVTFTGSLARAGVTLQPAYHVHDVISGQDYGLVFVSDMLNIHVQPYSAVLLMCVSDH